MKQNYKANISQILYFKVVWMYVESYNHYYNCTLYTPVWVLLWVFKVFPTQISMNRVCMLFSILFMSKVFMRF